MTPEEKKSIQKEIDLRIAKTKKTTERLCVSCASMIR